MARKRRRLGDVLPRQIREAAREAYEMRCRGRSGPGADGACLQGISYYERLARRKYEGILTTATQSNNVARLALRLCSINRKGNQRYECQAGAFAVHNEVKKLIQRGYS
jgi:hypothetical protein